MLRWLPPYRGTLTLYDQQPGDLAFGPGNGLVVSERLAHAFQQEQLQGIDRFYPIEISRVRGKGGRRSPAPLPPYLYALPPWGSAAVDESCSRIRRDAPISCDFCRGTGVEAIHGFDLEEGSWNGDDLFRPRGLSGTIVASARFEQFVARHSFTNITLTPTRTFVHDHHAPLPLDESEGSA